jgi:hypothetical protein
MIFERVSFPKKMLAFGTSEYHELVIDGTVRYHTSRSVSVGPGLLATGGGSYSL